MSEFACSVVIPSRNRADRLDLVLGALASQVTDEALEIIVVLDGCEDSSRDVLVAWEKMDAFASLRWHEQSRKGPAAARNTGAFMARGPILLFLDDDVIPDPDLVSVHLGHHASGDRIAVLGDYDLIRSRPRSICELEIWSWWEDTFQLRSASGQPASYRDFCTGNVSLRREDFARVGGFDQDFARPNREDYELGYRLLRSGVRFLVDRSAHARHIRDVTVRSILEGARVEARGDVLIAQKHPELINGLALMGIGDRRRRAAGLAMFVPRIGAVVCFAMRGLLWLDERLRVRRRWRSHFGFLWTYAYWRGLRDSVGSLKALRELRATAPPSMTQKIDVSRPLTPQVRRLNIDVQSRLLVVYGEELIGSIDLVPNNPEATLPWIVREISSQLSASFLLLVARTALENESGDTALGIWSTETG